MKQQEIAALFEQMADLLEYQGENVFRVRAYRRAAQSLAGFTGDLERASADQQLGSIEGIGTDLAAKISEYVATGSVRAFDALKAKVPSGVPALLEIPGVGPKTVKAVVESLKVNSVQELEQAIRQGRVEKLPGFGAKKAENILKGIEIVKRGKERMHLGIAYPLAQQVVAFLASLPGVTQASTAGSIRRMRETIGDLDVLAASRRPEAVMERFGQAPFVSRVVVSGSTKTSVMTREGVQIDLRVVKPESFGAALQYFTGSKEHNVELRESAVKRGLKINEYGVFNVKTGRRLGGKTEEEIYAAIDLPWMPPELREASGELTAAKDGTLPHLVDVGDLKGDFHIHSIWSDGVNTIDDLANAAQAKGYAYLAMCDHSQSLTVAKGMTIPRIRQYMRTIRSMNERFKGFRLLVGSEVDILKDGSLDYPDEILRELDFVVASVHTGFTQSEAMITQRIVTAMHNPYVTVVGHPTGRLLGQREPYAIDLEAVFHAALETGTALEINAYPQRLDLRDAAARRAGELGVMLAICTDSHQLQHLDNMIFGVGVARRAWLTPAQVLNCLPLKRLLAWIDKKRSRGAARTPPRKAGR